MAPKYEDIPSELHGVADHLRALPSDTPEGLEDRVFEASVSALREGAQTGVVGRIGFVRWVAPIAAAAAIGLVAWVSATWLAPPSTTTVQPDPVATVALDDHVSNVLEYADLFGDSTWSDTLAEDAEELDESWEPTVESWSLDGEMGAG